MVPFRWGAICCAMLVCAALGCSQEKVNELLEQGKKSLDAGAKTATETVDQAKAVADSAAGKAKETLQLSGKMEVTIDAPLTTAACYAKFVPAVGDQGQSILQLQSYRDAASESFPSVFLRASINAESAAALVGQTVDMQMYAQAVPSGPIWFSRREMPVRVQIVSVDQQQIVGQIVEGELQRATGGEPLAVTGQVSGVWPGP